MILRTAVEVLSANVSTARLRESAEHQAYDDALEVLLLEELDWGRIAVPERAGGLGLGLSELTLIAEELGRTLAPARVVMAAVSAACLADLGSAYAELARDVIDGACHASVGWRRPNDTGPVLVADGAECRAVLIFSSTGVELLCTPDLRSAQVETVDTTRRYAYVSGVGVPVSDSTGRLCAFAEVALAAELVGVAQAALDRAVSYATDRRQFGKSIGAFQAVAHRCADMALEAEAARATVRHAADSFDAQSADYLEAASAAVVMAVAAATHATASAIQVHGGLGFTWDHDLHFFYKRAQVTAAQLTHIREHRRRLATGARRAAGSPATNWRDGR